MAAATQNPTPQSTHVMARIELVSDSAPASGLRWGGLSSPRAPPSTATLMPAPAPNTKQTQDNTVKEVNASMSTLKGNIAKELCNVPVSDVTIWKVMDDSTKVAGIGNTQTLVYAACKAPNSKLEAVRDDCEDFW